LVIAQATPCPKQSAHPEEIPVPAAMQEEKQDALLAVLKQLIPHW
jgi:hypothetical protein